MLDLYNFYYNLECASLAHGGAISMQELQAMSLETMVKAFSHNKEIDSIPISEILGLAKALSEQGKNSYVEVPNF
jgi:hypothetical protein